MPWESFNMDLLPVRNMNFSSEGFSSFSLYLNLNFTLLYFTFTLLLLYLNFT